MTFKPYPLERPASSETDCAVVFRCDGGLYYRAPVSLTDKGEWLDEWGHDLDVVKFAELDPITK